MGRGWRTALAALGLWALAGAGVARGGGGVVLTPEEARFLAGHPVVRIAFDAHFPPYSFREDGRLKGFAVDVAQRVAERLGIEWDVSPLGVWADLFEAARRREVDVVATMVRRPEREAWFRFTRPYVFKSQVVVVREGGPRVERRADLAGKTVALVRGYQISGRITEEFPTVRPVWADTMRDALYAVATGRADAAVGFVGAVAYLRNRYLLTNLRLGPVYDRDSSLERFAVRADWPLLASALDKALASLTDAEWAALRERWATDTHLLPPPAMELTAEERAWVEAHPEVRLAFPRGRPPFAFAGPGGGFHGLAADLVARIERGLDLTVRPVPAADEDEAAARVRAGRADLAVVGRERDGLRSTPAVVSSPYVWVARPDGPAELGPGRLAGLRAAVPAGSPPFPGLEGAEVEALADEAACLAALAAGRVDAAAVTLAGLGHLARQGDLPPLRVAGRAGPAYGLRLAAAEGDPVLAALVARALAAIPEEDRREILGRWVHPEVEGPGVPRSVVWALSAGAAALALGLAGVALWNRSLRARVAARTEALEQARAEQEALHAMARRAAATLDPAEVAGVLLDEALARLEPARAAVFAVEGEGLRLLAQRAPRAEPLDHTPAWGECLCGRAAATGRAQVAADVAADPRCTRADCRRAGIGGVAAVPLVARGRVLGVLCAGFGPERDPEAVRGFLEALAGTGALSLENAELYQRLRHEAEHLERAVAERTAELVAANERLRELDRLKSLFIASMSHELRTPLNSIIGFAGVMLQELAGPLTDDQRDQLGRIYRAGKLLLALINDVIDISKIESGRVAAYPTRFDLAELVAECVETVRAEAEAKGLRLSVRVGEGPTEVETDRRRLGQCVLNLLANAVKYTPEGEVAVEAGVRAGRARVEVRDTGIGIAPGDRDRLFRPFERLDSPLRVGTPGTGLGLYLTRKLAVEVLGGDVGFESEPGRGSRFWVEVPARWAPGAGKEGEGDAGAGGGGQPGQHEAPRVSAHEARV
ncbi:MAG: GAF domain-containing protein [Candidatus Dadabacteria bacterium]|nr:MAG: GAF domain-containing protein [Candidatus Dadabacteria bacterium]